MLHIFLAILKIIGIFLVAVLGIVFILMLCVLFCPFRYIIRGQNKEDWRIWARISFLGPLFRFTVCYEQQVDYKFRILGIPVISGQRHNKAKKKKSVLDEEEKWDESSKAQTENGEKRYVEKARENHSRPRQKDQTEKRKNSAETEESWEQEEGWFSRTWKKIRDAIEGIGSTVKRIFSFLKKWKGIYEDEGVGMGLSKLKSEVFLLVGKIKPRKMKWYLKIGLEDPAGTGQLLAVLAILREFLGHRIQVEPDFENKVFETDFSVKGFIQGFRLVRLGWKYFFDQDIKYFMEKVKN